jgi:hypothetical protein
MEFENERNACPATVSQNSLPNQAECPARRRSYLLPTLPIFDAAVFASVPDKPTTRF